MATVNKDFRVKHGLVVEGTTGTINGEDIITTGFTTDSLSEGTTNQYFTDGRAKDSAAALLTTATLTNITITGTGNGGLTITAENGVADSDTDDLVEGINNLYYTDTRVKSVIDEAITNGTQTNITVTYDDVTNTLSFTAENGVADSTTDDLVEGVTNLYFTDQRAIDAVGGSAVSTNTPNTVVKRDGNGDFAAGTITADLIGNVTGTVSDISNHDTDDLAEGVTNLYFTESRARNSLSAGNGITYTSATGEIEVDTTVIADRNYVDSVAAGLTWKEAAHLLSDANVSLTGATGSLVIDGHSALTQTESAYRILLTGQTTATENGIYEYTDNGTTYTLTRVDDADTLGELVGASIFILEGTLYANTGWVQSDHYMASFADQDWVQFSGSGTYTGGTGININGNVISVDANTDEIVEGSTNLYFTDARAVSAVINGAVDTDDIEEGSTNLYFTDARAVTALEAVTPNFVSVDVNDVVRQVAATTLIELAATAEVVYSFAKSAYRSGKFLVKVSHGSHTEVSEVLLTLDTSDNVAITEYAVVGTNGSLGTIIAIAGASNVDLIVDAANDNSTVTVFGTLVS